VLIRPEGIKMEKVKVKDVLDWPTLKCVKDVQKFLGAGKLLSLVYLGLCIYS